MSTCWFIRSFKQYTGMPPRKYLTSIRVKKAQELLESTDYGIGEIGSIVGYDNPLYFSRIFKKNKPVLLPENTEKRQGELPSPAASSIFPPDGRSGGIPLVLFPYTA